MILVALIGLGIVIALSVIAIAIARWYVRMSLQRQGGSDLNSGDSKRALEQERQAIILTAKEDALKIRSEVEDDIRAQRAALIPQEKRLTQREESLERRWRELDARDSKITKREHELDTMEEKIEKEMKSVSQELQRMASLSPAEARVELLEHVEKDLTSEIANKIRNATSRAHEEIKIKAQEILVTAMQRYASEQTNDSTVTAIPLPSDELKGRIIGKEGRNIRALEAAIGVDIIVDDTPETIIISGFDPVRREVARMTLEKLFNDGRIHPARIEEVVAKCRSEIQNFMKEQGERACRDIGLHNVHPELVKLLGVLHFRYSYGRNVLEHSKETAAIAGMIAAEIGYDEQEVKEIALFHDIGKAAEHDVDGSHAIIGGEILARCGRPSNVVHAVRAHHYDEEPQTIGAFIIMTADMISADRYGARHEAAATAVKRVERIEAIANSFPSVEHSFAIHAGKELHVMVKPAEVNDDEAVILAHHIAKRLYSDAAYQGKIKVIVIRETRSVEYAS